MITSLDWPRGQSDIHQGGGKGVYMHWPRGSRVRMDGMAQRTILHLPGLWKGCMNWP